VATEVSIDFDASNSLLLIRGDVRALSRNPLVGVYLREKGGRLNSANELEIPTDEETLHSRYQDMTKLMARLGLKLAIGDDISAGLQKVRNEELAFETFSRAAEAIWHRKVNPVELSKFAAIIKERCSGRELYRRQLLAAYHLAFAQNACNFSVPGAGKTSIVYAAFAYLNSLPEGDPKYVQHLLAVGPLSSFKAWEDEFSEIFGRNPRVKRLAGFTSSADRRSYLRRLSSEARTTELTLTTYATLASSVSDVVSFLSSPATRAMVVLDEAHGIKREDGYWASAALEIAPYAAARVVLTGTPAPNGYEDLANLFRFIYPRKNIVGFSTNMLKAMTTRVIPEAVERLKANLRPFYTRIKKSDLGLPPAQEHRLPVPMAQHHERIYSGIERALMPQIRAAAQQGRSTLVRARLMRLRQAAVNPALLLRPLEEEGLLEPDAPAAFSVAELEIAEFVSQFRPETDLLRLQAAVDLVRDTVRKQGKVLIWSYFIGNLNLLRQALRDDADYVEILTGATPVSDLSGEGADASDLATREAIINRFHRPNETAILIANPQAVGESISLHKACRTAVYFDRDFNAGRFIQSKDRIHRYNPAASAPVTYHFMISANTIEAVIDGRLIQKEQRLADLIDSEEIPLFSLGDDDNDADIKAILADYERRKEI
jgi:SNF2 family DNA or RNA helicase